MNGRLPTLLVCALATASCGADDDLALTIAAAKADGVLVDKVGNITYYKIPLAETFGGDRKRLLDETVTKFITGMKQINEAMIARGVDPSLILDDEARKTFSEQYANLVERIVDTDIEEDVQVKLGESYDAPARLSTWRRYVIPQALLAYFGTRFTINWGFGGGISATVLLVAQPWMSIGIDHTMPQPTVVSKEYEVDVAILGVPDVEIGAGAGGGVPLQIGAGAVFGPLDHPEDLAGVGIGVSGALSLPIAGGGHGKFVALMKKPPLFMLLAGYNAGTAAGAELHGNIQALLDLEQFLTWIEQSVPPLLPLD